MKILRALFRLIAIIVHTFTLCSVYMIGLGCLAIAGIRYEPWRNTAMRYWSAGMCFILNMHIRIIGNVPEPPFFLVSNHVSYIDIVPIFKTLKCTFIAKKELESWPLIGFLIKIMGVIFIDRSRKRDVTRVNELISKEFNKYQGIVLFPEGTTSPGFDVLPFKASLLEYPAVSGLPVHYATIQYQTSEHDSPPDVSVSWWGEIAFPVHFFMLVSLKRIECTIQFGQDTIQHHDRKYLARVLHSRVEGQNSEFRSLFPTPTRLSGCGTGP